MCEGAASFPPADYARELEVWQEAYNRVTSGQHGAAFPGLLGALPQPGAQAQQAASGATLGGGHRRPSTVTSGAALTPPFCASLLLAHTQC